MNEMQFQYPTSALWLFAIAILIGMFALRERAISRFLSRVADPELLDTLLPGRNSLRVERKIRDILVVLVGLALLFALARPQWGFTWQESIKRGVDIVVAVDVSQSMLAEDIKPSRLVRAQREIMDLLDQLKGDRIGLVSFAGTAYLESPLTLDYSAFRGFLQSLSPKLIPIQGTNIEAAIRVSIRALKQTHKGLVSTSRSNVIVLITDGENFDGNVETAGEIARAEDVQIYIIGVGTESGAPIPGTSGYRRDDQGELILSRLHKNSLKSLAKSTGGTYVSSITSDQDTFSIYEQGIRKAFEGSEIDYMRAKTWNEYFQIPLGLGIAVLLIGPWGLLFRRTKEMLGARKEFTALLLFFLCVQLALLPGKTHADSDSAEFRQKFNAGSDALGRGDFATAIEHFSKLREEHPDDLRISNAEAISHYRLGQYEKASSILQQALEKGGDKQQMAEILYNLGNTAVQLQQYQEAVSYYEQSLNLMPDEQEAKDNLEYVKKLIEQQEQEDKSEDSEENKSEENKEEENQEEKKEEKNDQKNKDSEKKQNDKKDQRDESSSDQNQRSEDKKDKDKKDEDKRDDDSGEQSKKDSSETRKEESDKSEQSDDKEKSQDSKDSESEKDKKEKEREKANEGNPQSEPTPAAQQQAQAAQDEDSEQEAELSEQLEAQLENVEERSGTRMKFRLRKGIQQLDTFNMPAPEKDW